MSLSGPHPSEAFSTLTEAIASRLATDTAGIDDFAEYLATLAWDILPQDFQEASYEQHPTSSPENLSLNALPIAFGETLAAYGVLSPVDDADLQEISVKFLRAVLEEYLTDLTAPPAIGRASRIEVSACEICERSDASVFLSFHHLIPRSTHAMVRKRNMHPEERLQAVAWLCRQCHRMVHRIESNEELAKNWYTVEKLLERDDVQRWRAWAGKQGRRKKR
ncbi:hypothetical protein BKA62DRAFT_17353 [Auriculariales sp. MPI-PUGE-AT-0066]|nr:hypothetical protein BKA62DRAFT_17353 [Auriculariales sp. MPI-PUGE-AT-0066]